MDLDQRTLSRAAELIAKLDERLETALDRELDFEPIQIKEIPLYFADEIKSIGAWIDSTYCTVPESLKAPLYFFFGVIELYRRHKDTRAGLANLLIPNTIYVDSGRCTKRGELLRIIVHEATHSRIHELTRDDPRLKLVKAHPIHFTLNEGIAEYFADKLVGIYRTDEYSLAKDKAKLAKRRISDEGHWEPFEEAIRSKEQYYPRDAQYLTGRVFAHVVSKFLGERHLVNLAIDLFKPGVEEFTVFDYLKSLMNFYTGQEDPRLLISASQLQNPEKYVRLQRFRHVTAPLLN